jgi:dienelactone hydrolase
VSLVSLVSLAPACSSSGSGSSLDSGVPTDEGGRGGADASDAGFEASVPDTSSAPAQDSSVADVSAGDTQSIPPEASARETAAPEAASDATAGSEGPYGSDGPNASTMGTVSITSPNGTFSSTVYIPSGSGVAPVVILSSGFFQPGAAYTPYATRLASWGIITFLRDDPQLAESTASIVQDVTYTIGTFLSSANTDTSSPLFGRIDTTRVGLAGHSRGGQIALLAGEAASGMIKGVFGLDPVDTSTPPEAQTTLAMIGVPIAFIGETTDSAASSCAPAADNYQVLYQAAASPAVAITAVNADHTMFELPADCQFCTLCTAGAASPSTVLSYSVRYLTAFFARQLLDDASVGAAFEGAGITQDEAAGLVTEVSK